MASTRLLPKHWTLRQRYKYWSGNRSGKWKYYGAEVYFPPSHELFFRLCDQGVYESELIDAIRKYLPEDGVMFDVGANIGLTAIPILQLQPKSTIVSFEPSPNSLPFLKTTWQHSPFQKRWSIVEKAVGEYEGTIEFEVNSQEDGAFDGRQSTGRKGSERVESVPMTTLDIEWHKLNEPEVSVVKIDVEGFESEVLAGSHRMIASCRPYILLEWSRHNLVGLGREPSRIVETANNLDYSIFTLTSGRFIANKTVLDHEMLTTENFLLYPNFRASR